MSVPDRTGQSWELVGLDLKILILDRPIKSTEYDFLYYHPARSLTSGRDLTYVIWENGALPWEANPEFVRIA